MSRIPQRWRPLAQFDLDDARRLIEQAITSWRDDWFGMRASPGLSVQGVRLISTAAPYDFTHARRLCESDASPWWTLQRNASRLVAALALDLPAAPLYQTANNAATAVTALGDRITDELARALANVCEGPTKARPASLSDTGPLEGVLLNIIAPCGTDLCAIVCPLCLLLDHPAPRVPNRPRPFEKIASRREALSPTAVTLHARLGRAQITLDQLLNLAAGDVIGLDRKLDGPVDLFISSSDTATAQSIASGRLGRTHSRLSIQLAPNAVQDLA